MNNTLKNKVVDLYKSLPTKEERMGLIKSIIKEEQSYIPISCYACKLQKEYTKSIASKCRQCPFTGFCVCDYGTRCRPNCPLVK